MASVKAFNGMLYQFVEELAQAFPLEKKLQACLVQLPMLTDANPKKPMDAFLEAFATQSHKLTSKDESLFQDVPVLCGQIDVASLWSQADAGTRDAIWSYLQTLYFMASTVSSLPPQLLSSIENVAESCADKLENGELDMSQLLGALPNMLSSLMPAAAAE